MTSAEIQVFSLLILLLSAAGLLVIARDRQMRKIASRQFRTNRYDLYLQSREKAHAQDRSHNVRRR